MKLPFRIQGSEEAPVILFDDAGEDTATLWVTGYDVKCQCGHTAYMAHAVKQYTCPVCEGTFDVVLKHTIGTVSAHETVAEVANFSVFCSECNQTTPMERLEPGECQHCGQLLRPYIEQSPFPRQTTWQCGQCLKIHTSPIGLPGRLKGSEMDYTGICGCGHETRVAVLSFILGSAPGYKTVAFTPAAYSFTCRECVLRTVVPEGQYRGTCSNPRCRASYNVGKLLHNLGDKEQEGTWAYDALRQKEKAKAAKDKTTSADPSPPGCPKPKVSDGEKQKQKQKAKQEVLFD